MDQIVTLIDSQKSKALNTSKAKFRLTQEWRNLHNGN